MDPDDILRRGVRDAYLSNCHIVTAEDVIAERTEACDEEFLAAIEELDEECEDILALIEDELTVCEEEQRGEED